MESQQVLEEIREEWNMIEKSSNSVVESEKFNGKVRMLLEPNDLDKVTEKGYHQRGTCEKLRAGRLLINCLRG